MRTLQSDRGASVDSTRSAYVNETSSACLVSNARPRELTWSPPDDRCSGWERGRKMASFLIGERGECCHGARPAASTDPERDVDRRVGARPGAEYVDCRRGQADRPCRPARRRNAAGVPGGSAVRRRRQIHPARADRRALPHLAASGRIARRQIHLERRVLHLVGGACNWTGVARRGHQHRGAGRQVVHRRDGARGRRGRALGGAADGGRRPRAQQLRQHLRSRSLSRMGGQPERRRRRLVQYPRRVHPRDPQAVQARRRPDQDRRFHIGAICRPSPTAKSRPLSTRPIGATSRSRSIRAARPRPGQRPGPGST